MKWHYFQMAGRTKVLAVVATAISCMFVLASCSADSNPSEAAPIRSSSPSPTPSEPTALETFAELRKRANAIYAERDFKSMKDVYAREGKLWARVFDELKLLRRDRLILKKRDTILNREVIIETPSRIVLREKVISDGALVDESGKDVTADRDPQHQVVRWVLVRKNGRFLIYNATIEISRDA